MAVTPNKGYPLPVINGNPQTWGIILNQALGIIDSNEGGFTTVNCAGSSNVVVSSTQAANLTLQLTGALTGNIQLQMPAVGGFNIIDNQTTGSYSVTVISQSGGTATILTQGNQGFTYNDGTNQHIIFTLGSIANATVYGNISGSSATPYGVPPSALLDYVFGSTQGNILYRGASSWVVLGPGTAGYSLVTGGPNANPTWAFIGGGGGGSGTVTSVATDVGLTGGPITTSGTVGRDAVFDELNVLWYR